jgi:hypothetical protein
MAASASARPNPDETPVIRNVFAMGSAFPNLIIDSTWGSLIDATIGIKWYDLMQDIAQCCTPVFSS